MPFKEPSKHRRYIKGWWLQRYGLTYASFWALMTKQGGLCAICKDPPENEYLDIDHDHKTQKVRGLLCRACNRALGSFKEDPAILRRAAQFLEDSRAAGSGRSDVVS